jgi:hypothetical protein
VSVRGLSGPSLCGWRTASFVVARAVPSSEHCFFFSYALREITSRNAYRLPTGMVTCTPCTAPDGATPECETVFHLFLRLQDEHAVAQITVAVDQNVCSLCQRLVYVTHPSVRAE